MMTLFMDDPLKCSHFFVLGSGTSRKRKRRKEALQHLAANDCRQSIGELRDLSMGNSIDGSLLDDHTTPVKKGSASNLLQVRFFSLKYCFGRENSKFKFRKLRDLSMGNSILAIRRSHNFGTMR